MLVLADFQGPPRGRLKAYLTLAGIGVALIALGTVCSRSAAAGTSVMALVGFTILFAGLINRYFAAGGLAALLSFILAVNVPASASAIPARLEGWGLACTVGIAGSKVYDFNLSTLIDLKKAAAFSPTRINEASFPSSRICSSICGTRFACF